MGKNYYEETNTTITNDGEVIEVNRKVKKKIDRDKFIMLYLKDMSSVIDLNSKGEFKVLLSIAKISGYNDNEIRLGKDVKMKIAQDTGLAYNYVHNTINRLSKKHMIMKKKAIDGSNVRGVYILNPKYFFKGDDISRASLLRMVLEYHIL